MLKGWNNYNYIAFDEVYKSLFGRGPLIGSWLGNLAVFKRNYPPLPALGGELRHLAALCRRQQCAYTQG